MVQLLRFWGQAGRSLMEGLQYNWMMANYQRLTQILARFTSSAHIRAAEAELNELSEDPLIVGLLSMAVADPHLSDSTKLAAAVTLNRTISEHFHDYQDAAIIEQLLRLFFDFTVDFKYKHAVQNSFVSVLELAEGAAVDVLFAGVGRVVEGLKRGDLEEETMEENGANPELQKLLIIFYIYRCVLDANSHAGRLFEEIQKNLPILLPIVRHDPHPDNIATLYRMADFFAAFIEKTLESTSGMMDEDADKLCRNEQLFAWILGVYEIRGVRGQCWLSLENEPHATQLNDLKNRTAELHYAILAFMREAEVADRTILDHHCHASRILFNTLTAYAGCYCQLHPFEGFVTTLVRCLAELYRQRKETFWPIFATILHQAVFPLLAIKEVELRLFEDDPEEFHRLSEDCCDHQRFGILKTEVAVLLEVICDDNQQAAGYVVRHCVLSLKVRLALDENFEAQAPNFLTIETAFLVLSIQSYKLSKFQSEMKEMKKIMVAERIVGSLTKLELCRLFGFLAYNFGELYLNGLEGEAWIRLALTSDTHPSVEIAALDFITNVVQDYFTVEFLRDFGERTKMKGSLYISAFLKMLSVHMEKIGQGDMVQMVDVVLKLIDRELTAYARRDRKHTMDLGSCIDILKRILEPNYSADKPALRLKLWQITEFMAELDRTHYDDKLVRIITCLMKFENTLSQQTMAVIDPLMRYYQLDRLDKVSYLSFFNAVVMKGHASVAAHIAKMLIPCARRVRDCGITEQRVTKWKVAIGTQFLIIQNILGFHGIGLPADLIDQFVLLALEFIPPDDSPEDKYDCVLVARALNLLFLCHMNRRNEVALRKLLMFQDAPIFQGYDLRVLCLCLAKEIMRESDVVAITEMINLMVKAISSSRLEPPPIVAKKNPNSVKSATTIRITRVENYEYVLKFMVTPFHESQPEAELQGVINTMKNNNPYLFEGIAKSLTSRVYEKLKELMGEVMIDGKKRRIVYAGAVKEDGKLPNEALPSKETKKRCLDSEAEDECQNEQFDSKRRSMKKKKTKFETRGSSRAEQQNISEDVQHS